MLNLNPRLKVAAVAVLVAVLVAACGESGKDAGVGDRVGGKRLVVNGPDEFPNVVAMCIAGRMVVESTQNHASKWGAMSEANAPECAGVDNGGIPVAAR